MKTFVKSILVSLLLVGGLVVAVLPQAASAQSKADICEGIGLTGGTDDCTTPEGSPSVNSTIETVINVLSLVVGVIAVIMVIIGGLKYILSGGDANQVNSAKNTILFAVVGLVVVAMAQVIVRFVLNKATTTTEATISIGLTLS